MNNHRNNCLNEADKVKKLRRTLTSKLDLNEIENKFLLKLGGSYLANFVKYPNLDRNEVIFETNLKPKEKDDWASGKSPVGYAVQEKLFSIFQSGVMKDCQLSDSVLDAQKENIIEERKYFAKL